MTFKHRLSADDVSLLSAVVQFSAGVSYDDGVLSVASSDENALIEGALSQIEELRDAALSVAKLDLQKDVDQQAERERLKYITAGAGQAMTYARKAEEAALCLNAVAPDPEDFPMLAAEVGITATTLVGVAEVVAAANANWLQIGAAIEATRLTAKKAISEAETSQVAQLIAASVVWPSFG